jgi:hypothetical protein
MTKHPFCPEENSGTKIAEKWGATTREKEPFQSQPDNRIGKWI